MNEILRWPWIEWAFVVPCVLACKQVLRPRPFNVERRESIIAAGISLVCAVVAWSAEHAHIKPAYSLFAVGWFGLDRFSTPFPLCIAGLGLIIFLSTPRSKASLLRFSPLLGTLGAALAAFATTNASVFVSCLVAGELPILLELARRKRSLRLQSLRSVCLAGFLVMACVVPMHASLQGILLIGAMAVRCGLFPFHLGTVDLFENLSFSTTTLYIAPATGLLVWVRLVLPSASDTSLTVLAAWFALTALYTAGMSLIQTDARRFLGFVSLTLASLAGTGLMLGDAISMTGAITFWISQTWAFVGLALTLRAVESRVGRMSMAEFHGLSSQVPELAAFFLLSMLACVGFPGTLGFAASKMYMDGLIQRYPVLGVVALMANAFIGIAALRAYFMIFTGCRRNSTVPLGIKHREHLAGVIMTIPLLFGGIWPQPMMASRYQAAEELLAARKQSTELATVDRLSINRD